MLPKSTTALQKTFSLLSHLLRPFLITLTTEQQIQLPPDAQSQVSFSSSAAALTPFLPSQESCFTLLALITNPPCPPSSWLLGARCDGSCAAAAPSRVNRVPRHMGQSWDSSAGRRTLPVLCLKGHQSYSRSLTGKAGGDQPLTSCALSSLQPHLLALKIFCLCCKWSVYSIDTNSCPSRPDHNKWELWLECYFAGRGQYILLLNNEARDGW